MKNQILVGTLTLNEPVGRLTGNYKTYRTYFDLNQYNNLVKAGLTEGIELAKTCCNILMTSHR